MIVRLSCAGDLSAAVPRIGNDNAKWNKIDVFVVGDPRISRIKKIEKFDR